MMIKRYIVTYSVIVSFISSVLVFNSSAVGDPNQYDLREITNIVQKMDISSLKSKASILLEADGGAVLYENNSHMRLPIASITKTMSMLLIMEEIDSGKLKLDDLVEVSAYATTMGGSQAYLKEGEKFTVRDMLKAIAIHSSNDVTVAMAEKISGSESAFVTMMNEKSDKLGMKDTHFIDCTGLTDEGHYSTAYDIALLSKELVIKHPGILEFTSIWHDTFREGKFSLDNTNKLLNFYKGVDGLKTGFTTLAGYCLSATAKINDIRLITVILGSPDTNTRFAETKKLLDFGFANIEKNIVLTKGEEIQEVEVKNGVQAKVKAVVGNDLKLAVLKDQKDNITKEINLEQSIVAPIKAGQKIGEIRYHLNGEVIGRIDLVSDKNYEKASFIRLIIRKMLTLLRIK